MNEYLHWLEKKEVYIYGGIIVVTIALYFAITRGIKNSKLNIDQKRRTLNNVRAFFLFFLFSSFLVAWANEIYSLIISLTAIAAAVTIATKELILCLAGSFYRTINRPFTIGDRIVVDEVRGDVIESGLFATQLLEIGPKDLTHQYTGRAITIPNSKFLSGDIINETYSHEYVLHVFSVTIATNKDWSFHQSLLLEVAKKHCEQYVERARRHFQRISERKQLDTPNIEPRVNVKIQDSEEIQLIIRVTVPARVRGRIEQDITMEYLARRFNV